MNKFQIVKALRANGDSIISMYNDKFDKLAILATTDFSERYIKRKKSKRFTIPKDGILLFSWTDNMFKTIKVKDIKSILPLSAVLKNQSPEIKIDG